MTYENIEDYRFWNWVGDYPRDHGMLGILAEFRCVRWVRRRLTSAQRYHPND